ncbi:MAG: NAD(P)-dependent oxidoreductase [Bdellovibrionota bacterium]
MNGPCLITGATGLLGSEFASVLRGHDTHALAKAELDVTSQDSVQKTFKTVRPKLVIHTAAYTQVDGAEENREHARRLNAESVKYLVEASREYSAKLVHFSTDQALFDGNKKGPYVETDMPNPSNYYAETKLESESYAEELDDSLILRVQWLYGSARPRFTHL